MKSLYETSPHAAVRAFAIGRLIGHIPSAAQISWAASQAAPYEGPEFWVPYGVWRGAAYIQPWAIGLMNYMAHQTIEASRVMRLFSEPEKIYHELAAHVAQQVGEHEQTLLAIARSAEIATNPEWARNHGMDEWASNLDLMYGQVQLAAANENIIFNSRRIKRMMRAH